MIEVVYKEEKKKPVGNEGFFGIPKNIRQIGDTDGNFKIYIEDYAYHYLDRLSDEAVQGKIAILFGKINWWEGVTYVFIKSAFMPEGVEADENHLPFSEEIWAQAESMLEERFGGQEIVGWFFTMQECPAELTEAMKRAHLHYFAGNDKVFFLKEALEKEERFFRFENGDLCPQKGYYLYYERNDAMQELLVEAGNQMPMEKEGQVKDEAVRSFREIISRKQEENREQKSAPFYMYASAAAAIILALTLGTNFLEEYDQLHQESSVVQELSSETLADSGTDGAEWENPSEEDSVETVGEKAKAAGEEEDRGQLDEEPTEDTEENADTAGDAGADSGESDSFEKTGVKSEGAAAEEGQERDEYEETDEEGEGADREEGQEGDDSAETNRENKGIVSGEENEDSRENEGDGRERKSQNIDNAFEETDDEEEKDRLSGVGRQSEASSSAASRTYVIQAGDTLTSISRKAYGTSDRVAEICRLNGMTAETVIYPGEKILLP